jgi:hypothetical protein
MANTGWDDPRAVSNAPLACPISLSYIEQIEGSFFCRQLVPGKARSGSGPSHLATRLSWTDVRPPHASGGEGEQLWEKELSWWSDVVHHPLSKSDWLLSGAWTPTGNARAARSNGRRSDLVLPLPPTLSVQTLCTPTTCNHLQHWSILYHLLLSWFGSRLPASRVSSFLCVVLHPSDMDGRVCDGDHKEQVR